MWKAMLPALGISTLLAGCSYFDTAEQAEGRCLKKGVSKVVRIQGEKTDQRTEYLLAQYVNGCMAARGFRRTSDGKWAR